MKYIFPVLVFASILSCQKEFNPEWDTDNVAPLAYTSMSMSDMLQQNTRVESDSSLTLVFSEEIYRFSTDTLVELDVDPFTENITLQSLSLGNQTISQTTTLGQIYPAASGFHGATVPSAFLLPINGLSVGPTPIDATSFLQTATLTQGFMDIQIDNGFPANMENLTFEIRNNSDNSLVASGAMPNIPAGGNGMQTIDLTGTTIEGQLDVYLTNMDLTESMPFVTVDTNDAVTADITIRDLEVSSATAIFPSQEVVNNTDFIVLNNMGDVELTKLILDEGYVTVEAINTIEETMYFTYEIPDATVGGVPFSIDVTLPPASGGVPSVTDIVYDISGYEFDITNNQFSNSIVGNINSSGTIKSISLQDSIYINLDINGLRPYYVEGYLGQQTFVSGPQTIDINTFNSITGGTFDLADSKLSLRVENDLGIEGGFYLNGVAGLNTRTNQVVALNLGGIGYPETINSAVDTLTSTNTTVELNDVNSNTSAFIENMPDELTFNFDLETNPAGFTGSYNDFASINNEAVAYLDLEVPLELSTNGLVMVDTIQTNANVKRIEAQGTLTFLVENGFPADADLKVIFTDSTYSHRDSLMSTGEIFAAPVDGSNRVNGTSDAAISFDLERDRLNQLLNYPFVIFEVTFNTQPAANQMKLYDYYTIDVKMVGDFGYRVDF